MQPSLIQQWKQWLIDFLTSRREPWFLKRSWGPTWFSSTLWPSDSLDGLQFSLLRILSFTHTERVALGPIVRSFAQEHRGYYRYVLTRFAKQLESEVPLLTALEQTPDALSEDVVLALRCGSQTGTLNQTFEQLLSIGPPQANRHEIDWRNSIAYWCLLLGLFFAVVELMVVFVFPSLIRFTDSVEAPRPQLMAYAQTINHWLWMNRWLVLAAVGLGVWVLGSPGTRRFLRPLQPARQARSIATTHSARLFRLFAIGLRSGRPLSALLSTLARYHFDKGIRQRLLFARNEVEQGEDPWKSLCTARLFTEAESLAMSVAPSNDVRAWTLEQWALMKQGAAQRTTGAMLTVFQPLVVFVFASLVLLLCYTMLSTMTQALIHLV